MSGSRRGRLVALLVGTLTLLGLAALPAQAGTSGTAATNRYLSAVNLNDHCRATGGGEAVRTSGSASGWVCRANNTDTPLSITDACRHQFADLVSRGYLVTEDPNNTNATERSCYGVVDTRLERGGMDLAGYCRSLGLGYTGAYNSLGNVDSWYCDGPADVRLDLNSACKWQNPTYVASGYIVAAAYANYGAWARIGCIALA
jgi:hypothetical protein